MRTVACINGLYDVLYCSYEIMSIAQEKTTSKVERRRLVQTEISTVLVQSIRLIEV